MFICCFLDRFFSLFLCLLMANKKPTKSSNEFFFILHVFVSLQSFLQFCLLIAKEVVILPLSVSSIFICWLLYRSYFFAFYWHKKALESTNDLFCFFFHLLSLIFLSNLPSTGNRVDESLLMTNPFFLSIF